jgi:hypothetical protein
MTPLNWVYEVFRSSSLVMADPGTGNTAVGSGVINVVTSFQMLELITSASANEIRTLPAPTKSDIVLRIVFLTKTSSFTVAVNTKDSAGNNPVTYTFTTQGSLLKLVSAPSAVSNSVKTLAWVPEFSNL